MDAPANNFYARNRIAQPMPNAKSPSEVLDSRSREIILRNVFLQTRNTRAWRGRGLWSWVGAMTAFGSGYSMQVCEELGWDPHMRIGPKVSLPYRDPAPRSDDSRSADP